MLSLMCGYLLSRDFLCRYSVCALHLNWKNNDFDYTRRFFSHENEISISRKDSSHYIIV